MLLQKVTLQPIDSLFFYQSCWLRFANGSLATFLSQNLFIPNRPALRHFKHASQDSLYTFCHAKEQLETSSLPVVATSYFSYTAIYTVACLQTLFVAFQQAFSNSSIFCYIFKTQCFNNILLCSRGKIGCSEPFRFKKNKYKGFPMKCLEHVEFKIYR